MRRGVFRVVIACIALGGAVAAGGDKAVEAARSYRMREGARILRDFTRLLTIPNTPAHPEGLRRNAEWIRDRLTERGVEATLWHVEGAPPVVYGRLGIDGATRTLGIYVHYDGQPVEAGRWTSPPFEPTLYDGRAIEAHGSFVGRCPATLASTIDPEWRIYARSSGDDKALVRRRCSPRSTPCDSAGILADLVQHRASSSRVRKSKGPTHLGAIHRRAPRRARGRPDG